MRDGRCAAGTTGGDGRRGGVASAAESRRPPGVPQAAPETAIDNGSLEGAARALLSREFRAELGSYLGRITYIDLSDLPGYMDEFVGASFLPHTDPAVLGL